MEMVSTQTKKIYQFGPFRLDPAEHLLLRDNQSVPLTPKAFETLTVLVQLSGHLVSKEQLLKSVWPDTTVEESNLSIIIHRLRKALGDDRGESRYIETVSKLGYRFVAEVSENPEVVEQVVESNNPSGAFRKFEEERDALPSFALSPAPSEVEPSRTASVELAARQGIKDILRRAPVLMLGVSVIGLAVAFFYVWFSNRQIESERASAVAKPVKSIAVLPFKTLSAEKDDEFLGLGVTDTLINSLSRTRQFVVRQMSAVLKYTDQDKDPLAAGSEQGVEAVLAGRIHRVGNRVRVTAQLVRVSDGVSLWADRFDEEYTHIFAVEDAIAEKVALAMTRSLAAAYKPITSRPTGNSEAYQAYLKGQYFLNKRTGEGLKKGIESFEQAIARDPNFAAAYAGLSDCLALLNIYDVLPPKDAFEKARVAATTALVLDDNLAEAHASLGLILMYHDWDWMAAEREYVRAIALNPDYPIVHQWRALNLAALGRLDDARAEIKRAQELDPPSLIVNTNVGWIAYLSGQYDLAIDQFQKTVELDPKFSRARVRMGIVYAQKKMYPEAKEEFRQALNLSAGNPYALSLMGYVSALSGDHAEAQKILATLKPQSDQHRIIPFGIGLIYTGLGAPEQALAWLEKALEQHPDSMIFLKVDPAFNSLRTHPKFTDLLRRMRLAN